MDGLKPICPYCGNFTQLVDGKQIYPHRKDLRNRKFWSCEPCNAYVGTHQNGYAPLGRVANKTLRHWKLIAHCAFDKLWKSENMTRTEAYKWLAGKLGIEEQYCHIGMFDVAICKMVVEICNPQAGGGNERERV